MTSCILHPSCCVLLRATEGTYTFSDGTSFTLTGGTIGTSDATWSTGFTAWKDGQPKDDADKQEKQDCVKVLLAFIYVSLNSFLNTLFLLEHQLTMATKAQRKILKYLAVLNRDRNIYSSHNYFLGDNV